MSEVRAGMISIVIPLTETDTDVRKLIEAYSGPLTTAGREHEFVFVLDGVAGRVEHELKECARSFPVKIVRLQGGGLGEAIALSAGVDRAAGDLIINAPQYLQAVPEDVLKLTAALESGADFVATWRQPRVDPWLNRVQSRVFNWFLRVLMGIKFHDLNSSLRGMRPHVLDEVNVYGELYRFLPVLAMRQGFGVVEVKVRHLEEKGRKGFYGLGVYVRRFLDILAITFLTRFTQKPLRFFGVLGLFSMLIGVALCVDPLLAKFAGESLRNRPIFVLGTMLFAFGVQLIGFGLVGEIIIFTQARNLREYKIAEHVEGVESGADVPQVHTSEQDGDMPLRVRELLPGEDARWDAFVGGHAKGSFFHVSGWRKAVEDVFEHPPHYLVAERGRSWSGILPLFWVRSPFVGKNLISTPYAVYGGVLADDPEAASCLRAAAESQGRELGAGYVELRSPRAGDGDLVSSNLYVTYRKELPRDPDEILPAIPKKARAEVRRARDRFALGFAESRDLDCFFDLFMRSKRRLGTPTLPRRWFRALLDEFGSQVVMHVARLPEGRTIAAVMSFCFKDTVHAYYSGSDEEHHRTGVNDFIYCRIMEWAVQNGYTTFDFGRSRRGSGAASFKKNMGFVPQDLHYEYLLLQPGTHLPAFHPSNPRLRLPQRIWSNLPVFVTHHLGGRLSRYLP